MAKRDIYIALMVAGHKGVGLHLSAAEVWSLARDSAIEAAALNGLDEADWPEWKTTGPPKWEILDPYRNRVAQDLMTKAPEDVERDKRRAALPPS